MGNCRFVVKDTLHERSQSPSQLLMFLLRQKKNNIWKALVCKFCCTQPTESHCP